MDFLMNELSVHGQFATTNDFFVSVETVMMIRAAIQQAGRELYCHRNLAHAQVTAEQNMSQAIQEMERNARRAWMRWLTRQGPFWVAEREHAENDWLETEDGTIVTDSGVGEAAFCILNGLPRAIISVHPSGWQRDPLFVTWRKNELEQATAKVPNHWSLSTVEKTVDTFRPPFDSWESLEKHLRDTCHALIFSDDFMQLNGYPYVKSVGERIFIFIRVLNKLSDGIDDDGNRTEEAKELYEIYFKGDAPYFTDESTQNKVNFKQQMMFRAPSDVNAPVFCPWHGKVNSPTNFPPVRIHFTWPIKRRHQLYVAYVGKKRTMK